MGYNNKTVVNTILLVCLTLASVATATEQEGEAALIINLQDNPFQCIFNGTNGKRFDLGTLSATLSLQTSNATYYIMPCGTFSDKQPCGALTIDSSVCEVTTKNQVQKRLGSIETATEPPKNQSGVMTVLYSNGASCPSGATSQTYVTFVCQKNTNGELRSVSTTDNCNYKFEVGASIFCNKGGLTGGDIFLIVFFSVLGGYFLLGVSVQLYRGHRGVEMIPNREGWGNFFSLIRDGGVFIKNKITGGQSGAYSSLG
ncbi:hypothetical protein SAMD00019534_021380 [Acytostelium subglobosum LB1]|uniref:hypothetical protein n=1 Tax=Acytostelium subglobosum LB1 TaxID=1410327 RepID=UPI000645233E|nr:hypothetical protein SAMD00019534_021380 [Acytostelium subglobosum LB1]GAM18963.1 hypothetical protein SAMD00019534_021380 [Acytostelium subglobosum LB1]|eukprot:XP_012758183.1 hypothetical protein SAMD00019534_021380 [Acytostelium subglobosum LB1]